jgi:glycosyltransferase involved in cell wall biosynthesis
MNKRLGVSIIVVNYNNAPFLSAAIDSALGQSLFVSISPTS